MMSAATFYPNYAEQAASHDEDRTYNAEALLAEMMEKDLGVKIDAQALRIFLRWRWDRVQKLAHRIHEA